METISPNMETSIMNTTKRFSGPATRAKRPFTNTTNTSHTKAPSSSAPKPKRILTRHAAAAAAQAPTATPTPTPPTQTASFKKRRKPLTPFTKLGRKKKTDEKTWEQSFQDLIQFQKRFKHVSPRLKRPVASVAESSLTLDDMRHPKWLRLGRWLARQKCRVSQNQARYGSLTEEQLSKLEGLGVNMQSSLQKTHDSSFSSTLASAQAPREQPAKKVQVVKKEQPQPMVTVKKENTEMSSPQPHETMSEVETVSNSDSEAHVELASHSPSSPMHGIFPSSEMGEVAEMDLTDNTDNISLPDTSMYPVVQYPQSTTMAYNTMTSEIPPNVADDLLLQSESFLHDLGDAPTICTPFVSQYSPPAQPMQPSPQSSNDSMMLLFFEDDKMSMDEPMDFDVDPAIKEEVAQYFSAEAPFEGGF